MPSIYVTNVVPQSGPMRHRVSVLLPTLDTTGSQVALDWDTPAEKWNVWAGFQEIQPKEQLEAGREKPKAKGLFWTRFRGDIARVGNNACRVIFGTATWEVERIENPGGERKLLLMHTQLLSEG